MRWSEQANRASPCAPATGYAKSKNCNYSSRPSIRADSYSLRFEDLLREPRGHLEQVVEFLGVEFTAAYSHAIELLNLQPLRTKWKTEWNPNQLATVLKEVQPLLGQLGYTD